ncbi:hypothetical protein [Nonomuraea terrae]|uniref:hypothetical protein n=1 Tax=Nonomuraea terrae TaxID=2530383 RepID=UPI0010514AA7|nr:hypothetical protein [Nonomuraea terrae]
MAITPTYPTAGGEVEAWSSRQPCNRWHSDTVLFRDENTLWTYVSRITVSNGSGVKVGSLESPRVWI